MDGWFCGVVIESVLIMEEQVAGSGNGNGGTGWGYRWNGNNAFTEYFSSADREELTQWRFRSGNSRGGGTGGTGGRGGTGSNYYGSAQ